ncbi:MAG: hypothetical protein H5U07_01220 [Candidatus Aminicenantes bacterium]|nr:hypothetical protein [Candidatus Aminicenantes bacterium]
MKERETIENLKAFDESKYINVDLDHLIMYSVGYLKKIGVDLSLENVVVAAFRLFPKKFSLLGFPYYPDSLRVYSCLWRCTTDKKKQWLGGKIRQGFIITERGEKFIKEAEALLKETSIRQSKAMSQTRRKEAIIAEVSKSSAFLKYINGQGESITEAEFCFLLQGTLDSSKDILRENFLLLRQYAEELNRKDIVDLLDWLKIKFKTFLNF